MKNVLYNIRDEHFFKDSIAPYLPEHIINVHTYIWLNPFAASADFGARCGVTWLLRVADTHPIENLIKTYELLFLSLANSKVMFDISANTNASVFICSRQSVRSVSYWVLICRSHACDQNASVKTDGISIWFPGNGMALSGDSRMREADAYAERELIFFLYEELAAMMEAGSQVGLSPGNFHDIYYPNARVLFGKEQVRLCWTSKSDYYPYIFLCMMRLCLIYVPNWNHFWRQSNRNW